MYVKRSIEEWLAREFYEAYLVARKHKRSTQDEQKFEMNAMENILRLVDDVLAHRYKPSRGVAFIISRPVTREIFAAPFRDRVIHHFLYNMVADWWDRRFIYDSYSCRKGKGTLLGVKRLQKMMNQVAQESGEEAWVIKLDLQGYFMSLPRRKVFERVKWGLLQQYPDHKWKRELVEYLWREVIFDDPIQGVRIKGNLKDWDRLPQNKSLFFQPPGRGVVIGNLSSQLISNIYLDQLDRFMTHELGYKHYGRYVDDFFIVVAKSEMKQAMRDVILINDFLRGLGLTLHPKKRHVQAARRGIEFLGMVVYPYSIVPSRRFKGNFYLAVKHYQEGIVDEDSLISYLGHLKHVNGRRLAEKFFRMNGLDGKLSEEGKLLSIRKMYEEEAFDDLKNCE